MLRLVVDDEGQLWPDISHKAPGRGAYLCMQDRCFHQLNERSVVRLRRYYSLGDGQFLLFLRRFEDAVKVQLMRNLCRLIPRAALGRDAVMHKMWHHAPLLLIVADDAGKALHRQMDDAVEKRRNDGSLTEEIKVFSGQYLADACRREKISVLAVACSLDTTRLQQYTTWLGLVKDAG